MRPSLVMAGPSAAVLARASGTLTLAENERAERFLQERDRHDFVAAHLLVRQCAATYLGLSANDLTLVQHCEEHGPGHGRPSIMEVPDLGVSLSHTPGYVCAVVGMGQVGVDAELAPEGDADPEVAGLALTPRETALVGGDNRRMIRQWVRKEALVKRGELSLDRFPRTDLSELPLDPSPRPANGSGPYPVATGPSGDGEGVTTLEWRGRRLLEWTAGIVIATAITDHPAELRRIDA
ncbi:hypothetical protein GCM10022226_28340 [Sphaerisporangium flaviroseum]|uniref:4'-phosphopantetheinyl transferase N-terminal domain-containing protein n=1 Tax=Sphaerisporangium flaviroseum TaxID=509199 RepID=A0ABP7I564_9ACTN